MKNELSDEEIVQTFYPLGTSTEMQAGIARAIGRAIIRKHEAQRQDAETWSLYIASMVEAYLQSQPAADKREAAIAGIISRRLWALSDRAQRQAVQAPVGTIVVKGDNWHFVWPLQTPDLPDGKFPVYAAPQPAQVPLTDAALTKLAVEDEFLLFCDEDDFIQIARAIEQAHCIKPTPATQGATHE